MAITATLMFFGRIGRFCKIGRISRWSGRSSGDFPPRVRLDVISLASSTTDQQDCPATRWALDDLAATLINRNAHDLAMSRSTIWRILDEADLKPHRSVYWLNSHDPDFDAKAQEICKLYIAAPMMLPTRSIGDLL